MLCDIRVLFAFAGLGFVPGDLERFNGVLLSGVERAHSFVKLSRAHVFNVKSSGEDLVDKGKLVLFGLSKVRYKERVISV